MGRIRHLTTEQIEEAKKLREKENLSTRKLAVIFEVAPTTIWESVYAKEWRYSNPSKMRVYVKRPKYQRCASCTLLYNPNVQDLNHSIGGLCTRCCVKYFKAQGHTSQVIADFMRIDLEIINKYWI